MATPSLRTYLGLPPLGLCAAALDALYYCAPPASHLPELVRVIERWMEQQCGAVKRESLGAGDRQRCACSAVPYEASDPVQLNYALAGAASYFCFRRQRAEAHTVFAVRMDGSCWRDGARLDSFFAWREALAEELGAR